MKDRLFFLAQCISVKKVSDLKPIDSFDYKVHTINSYLNVNLVLFPTSIQLLMLFNNFELILIDYRLRKNVAKFHYGHILNLMTPLLIKCSFKGLRKLDTKIEIVAKIRSKKYEKSLATFSIDARSREVSELRDLDFRTSLRDHFLVYPNFVLYLSGSQLCTKSFESSDLEEHFVFDKTVSRIYSNISIKNGFDLDEHHSLYLLVLFRDAEIRLYGIDERTSGIEFKMLISINDFLLAKDQQQLKKDENENDVDGEEGEEEEEGEGKRSNANAGNEEENRVKDTKRVFFMLDKNCITNSIRAMHRRRIG